MTKDTPTCPRCKASGITLKYPTITKLNPLSPLKLFAKAVKGTFDDQIVICPECKYKAPYRDFFENTNSSV